MNYNDNTFNAMPGNNSSRRLTRRPMETPGLDVNNMVSQQVQYNYSQPTNMYTQPDTQSLPPQQQFYYNDFTSISSQLSYGNNDFRYSGTVPINNTINRQHYTSSPSPIAQANIFNPASNLVNAFGSNPILAGATVQYGQKMLGHVVDENVGKYTSGISSQIKLYFAVDTHYVISKLVLLLFPFTHKDWSILLDSDVHQTEDRKRTRPKSDLNMPDMYIPTVSFITYLLLLGLILGKQNQFSPELLSVQASRMLAWELFIVVVEMIFLYITNIQSSLCVLDLTAYSGYKYFGIVSCIPIGLIFGDAAFYISLMYTSITFIYFLLFSMRIKLNTTPMVSNMVQPIMIEFQRKRTLYFLILALIIQPLTTWFLISQLTFSTN
ncbi:Yif1 family [Cinara cedri]|uniref:Protein YIF1 n=1 Tax=Cinara cedri TaxID=506608 RepID=A0A5E4MYP7_9HEMI|nr:Yif1 family [Cinara cedri]